MEKQTRGSRTNNDHHVYYLLLKCCCAHFNRLGSISHTALVIGNSKSKSTVVLLIVIVGRFPR